MFYASCGPDAFNKSTTGGPGTLIQNWQEERILRDETGVGRTVHRNHLEKNHLDLFTKSATELKELMADKTGGQDETFGRVFGRRHDPTYLSEHRDKYSMKKVYKEAEFGKKFELMNRKDLEQIEKELDVANVNDENFHNQRYLNTTYGNEFTQKNLRANALGRKVMRDQNGKSLAPSTRDEDLLVDQGFLKPNPLSTEEELKAAVKKESYVRAQPYTFWAEKSKDGAYYNSKQTGDHAPFSRNNEFLNTFPNYTHIKN